VVNALAASDEHEYTLTFDVREGKAIACLEGYAEILEQRLEGEQLHFRVQCRQEVLAGVRKRVRSPGGMTVEGGPPAEDDGY
jgi:pyrroline-5-carboxylate reductase